MNPSNPSYPAPEIPDHIDSLLKAGAALSGHVLSSPGATPAVIVPEGYKLHVLQHPPAKVPRAVSFEDVASFAEYVDRYKTPGTLLFATLTDTECQITAKLDLHDDSSLGSGPAELTWCSHTARLDCTQTQEWKTWMASNGRSKNPFTQVEFAQFLEDNERVFREPNAAELLELITTLEGKNDVRFSQSVRLTNGRVQLHYEEDVKLQGTTANGKIELPAELMVALMPFENGSEPYAVRARLRHRIRERQLVFWYETVAPHLILREASRAVLAEVRARIQLPVLLGKG